MKLNLTVFILILLAAFGAGIAIQYYGRTCPACQRRKQMILDAFSGAAANGDAITPPTPIDVGPIDVGLKVPIDPTPKVATIMTGVTMPAY